MWEYNRMLDKCNIFFIIIQLVFLPSTRFEVPLNEETKDLIMLLKEITITVDTSDTYLNKKTI